MESNPKEKKPRTLALGLGDEAYLGLGSLSHRSRQQSEQSGVVTPAAGGSKSSSQERGLDAWFL